MENDALNNSPSPQDSTGRTPEKIGSKANVNINAKHYKKIGCPIYELDTSLQQQKSYYK